MLNRRPWGPLYWVLAFFTASYQQLLWSPNSIGVPEGPFGRVWLSLPHLAYSDRNSTQLLCLDCCVLTELYNSSTPTRSPTCSLKSHFWSSSSGNNCHTVHRSLSSRASLCSGTVGPSPCPILSALICPRDLFRLLAIGMCHFLPVHHLGMAFLVGSKGKNITKVWTLFSPIYGLKGTATALLWGWI